MHIHVFDIGNEGLLCRNIGFFCGETGLFCCEILFMCGEIGPVLGSIPDVSVSSLQNRDVCLRMNVLADYKHVHLFRHLVARARA